jgi:Holliday junction resolvase
MSASQRRKGLRVEQEIVNAHREIGVHAERVPLSGAAHYRGERHDIDIYAFGRQEAPAVAEVKARKEGTGFALLERWLGEYDALFLKRNRQEPLVVIPWRVWSSLIRGGAQWQAENRNALHAVRSARHAPVDGGSDARAKAG